MLSAETAFWVEALKWFLIACAVVTGIACWQAARRG
jgi:hypothetical protein